MPKQNKIPTIKTSGTKNFAVAAELCPRGAVLRRLFAVAFVLRLIVLFRVAIVLLTNTNKRKKFKQDRQDKQDSLFEKKLSCRACSFC